MQQEQLCRGEICVSNFRPPATVARMDNYIFEDQLGNFQQFPVQNFNIKGGQVYEKKLPTLVFGV